MAQKPVISLVDDLDGTDAEQTVQFGLDGVFYEIDLSDDNAERLREALAEYIEHARRVGRRRRRRTAADQAESARIREWALQNGFDLGTRGRLPGHVIEAFRNAHKKNP